MELFTDGIIAGLLDKSLETGRVDEHGWRDHSKRLIEVPAATTAGQAGLS